MGSDLIVACSLDLVEKDGATLPPLVAIMLGVYGVRPDNTVDTAGAEESVLCAPLTIGALPMLILLLV